MSKPILTITGASGRQASQLIALSDQLPYNLRLIVHSDSSVSTLSSKYSSAEILQLDLALPGDAKKTVEGAAVVYHVNPSLHPSETQIGLNIVEAAKNAYASGSGALKHLIFSSVVHSQLRKLMNHDGKRYVEEEIIESGLPFTILKPSHFMDNIPYDMLKAQNGDEVIWPALWSPDTKFTFTAQRDLAAVAAKVILEGEKHFYATYEICSTSSPMSFSQIAEIVAKKLGKSVKVQQKEYSEAVGGFLQILFKAEAGSIDPRIVDAAERLLLYYNRRGLVGNSNVLEWVLGKKGTTIEEWIDIKAGGGSTEVVEKRDLSGYSK